MSLDRLQIKFSDHISSICITANKSEKALRRSRLFFRIGTTHL